MWMKSLLPAALAACALLAACEGEDAEDPPPSADGGTLFDGEIEPFVDQYIEPPNDMVVDVADEDMRVDEADEDMRVDEVDDDMRVDEVDDDMAVDEEPEPDMATVDLDMAVDEEPEPDMARPEPDMAPLAPDMMIDDRQFSFFVTSIEAMRNLSGSQDGFGGDLGGLDGADGICQLIAISVGMGHKEWRAFLSATSGPDGEPVHAIERIGEGPWYDANGRLIAEDIDGLLNERPDGDPQTIEDLPDEHGVPLSVLGDSHDILTGSNRQGRLNNNRLSSTCNDWTSASGNVGNNEVMCGHSWPRSRRSGRQWISDHPVRGCAPGVNLIQNGGGVGNCVGCGGGYGAIYCFALTP